MLKLIKKDIRLLLTEKTGSVLFLIGTPLLFLISTNAQYNNYFMIIYLLNCLGITQSFYYDNKGNSQMLILSLPINRKEIVLSKYIVVPIYFIASIAFINLWNVILNYFGLYRFDIFSIREHLGLFFIISTVTSITLPMYFSFSYTVANVISYVIIFTVNNTINRTIIYAGEQFFKGNFFNFLNGFGILILSIIFLSLSMLCSIAIYKEADFI